MKIELLHSTPLFVASTAIRKCWASEDKSDTVHYEGATYCGYCEQMLSTGHTEVELGEKDKELIYRIGNKNKHSSTLEHLSYSFDIDGISRACLQELARHRMASYSVKSTRYTLKELRDYNPFHNDDNYARFFVATGNKDIDETTEETLGILQSELIKGISNDKAKYMLPEAYKTSLVMTINARSLQNFLELRTSPHALWEIRELAYGLFDKLPDEHKYLFSDFLYAEEVSNGN